LSLSEDNGEEEEAESEEEEFNKSPKAIG